MSKLSALLDAAEHRAMVLCSGRWRGYREDLQQALIVTMIEAKYDPSKGAAKSFYYRIGLLSGPRLLRQLVRPVNVSADLRNIEEYKKVEGIEFLFDEHDIPHNDEREENERVDGLLYMRRVMVEDLGRDNAILALLAFSGAHTKEQIAKHYGVSIPTFSSRLEAIMLRMAASLRLRRLWKGEE